MRYRWLPLYLFGLLAVLHFGRGCLVSAVPARLEKLPLVGTYKGVDNTVDFLIYKVEIKENDDGSLTSTWIDEDGEVDYVGRLIELVLTDGSHVWREAYTESPSGRCSPWYWHIGRTDPLVLNDDGWGWSLSRIR